MKRNKRFYIPAKWREEFDLQPGKDASITLHQDELWIQEPGEETDIVCTIGRGGSVLIPTEIVLLANFKNLQMFSVYVDREKRRVVLKAL
ncbi:hypothetical protein [Pseudalkalibacillus caeni]|uniref:SpoVT-AbrB domain-containing protein n=1 Tax=Exobacillus caeni TaxID=2574798 RepID=A0A5R9F9F2_9BACL|nr:hypothetical protein [Pseudalkalibacillus caeni]TLS38896.1 hypothetical protein FCL54_00870 [Pseudalkalibacillus caeni]